MANVNPQQAEKINIQERWNLRGITERYITGQHVSLPRLKELILQKTYEDPMKKYIEKEMPPYPTPVEFWISDVAHVTEKSGFRGILDSEEFRPAGSEFLWWGLKINREEIRAAEERYKEKFQHEAEKLNVHKPFLENFTTSPLFELDKSRYGNYRFTFPLTKVMDWYKEQNCRGEEPVLRVFETVTYKQEIMYTVLIHSPENNQRFGTYPLLEESKLVHYKDGKIIWKAQAVCETHQYAFVSGEVKMLYRHIYYVWDHVSLVLHLPYRKSLEVSRKQLIEALDACKPDGINLAGNKGCNTEERFLEAEKKVSELKRELELEDP